MVVKNEEEDSKTSLGSKILDYVPWRIALTVAAFAIPVIGPVVGAAVGALTYGNYRKNNKTKNPASDDGPDESSNKESKKESAQPSRLARLASEVGTIAKRIGVIAIGFLLGGPIGGIIAIGLMVVDGISGGKVFQIVEKVLDAVYDALSGVEDKIQDAGKLASDKTKDPEKGKSENGEKIGIPAQNTAKDNKQPIGPATERLAKESLTSKEQKAGKSC
ncbi:hypothetical protein [Wolbachia endosymbiont of Ctenocephalides felis wCfeJ]|uniref:hypothetical protein n=1 Tax=Wolbachia endosymbiont of Ctenocephalides felis wCfeJ TaxID=2732594 RepID=UPI00144695EC|nr:hypothetical protein [Wolbachia endosymbiont of Ctenocephalides felis wCfeJ]WCR57834.1 MAG: hypothetical protein PG980_000306 [Wolbachia endosymbiont of Ctenocephalides felis wCfeJ]